MGRYIRVPVSFDQNDVAIFDHSDDGAGDIACLERIRHEAVEPALDVSALQCGGGGS